MTHKNCDYLKSLTTAERISIRAELGPMPQAPRHEPWFKHLDSILSRRIARHEHSTLTDEQFNVWWALQGE